MAVISSSIQKPTSMASARSCHGMNIAVGRVAIDDFQTEQSSLTAQVDSHERRHYQVADRLGFSLQCDA
ncbi:hypothetical protein ACWDUL_08935 [Nocardia niigatensis]